MPTAPWRRRCRWPRPLLLEDEGPWRRVLRGCLACFDGDALALLAGGRYRTHGLSSHSTTNAEVIGEFLGDAVTFDERGREDVVVEVRGRS